MLGEDVQDQRRAVDDLDLDHLLQRVELRRAQFAVADHGVGSGRGDDLTQLLSLAGTDIGRRVGFVATLDDALQDLRAGGLGQRGEFSQAGVGVGGGSLHPHPDQHHAFQPQLAVLDFGDVGEFGGQPGHAAQRDAVLEGEFADARVGVRCGHVKVSHTRPMVSRPDNVAHPNYVAVHR